MEETKINNMFVLAFIILFSCSTSTRENGVNDDFDTIKSTDQFMEQDTIRPNNIGQSARLINVNFDDDPIYQWIEYVGLLEGSTDVHGFRFYNQDGSQPSMNYYKRFGGIDTDTPYQQFDIMLGLGTSNLWLKHKDEQAWFCYINTEKNQEIVYKGKSFKEVTSVNNVKYENWEAPFNVVVSPEVYLHFERLSDGLYNVFVMDELKQGKIVKYELRSNREVDLEIISYFDWRDGKIYLPGGLFLEPTI